MFMTTTQLLEVLNHDKKNRFLKPFDRMHIHKEISNSLNNRLSLLNQRLVNKIKVENKIGKFL
jgi:hypothetical protein